VVPLAVDGYATWVCARIRVFQAGVGHLVLPAGSGVSVGTARRVRGGHFSLTGPLL
jgi:hypothetical protein